MTTAKGLTEAVLKNAKPRAKAYKLYDRDRLYALVSVAGTKRWYWSYRLGDKDVSLPLGRFPDVGIKEARERRAEAAKLVDAGVHPQAYKEAAIAVKQAEQANTLWPVAEEWLEKKSPGWGASYVTKMTNLLERYVRDGLGARPIAEIQTGDIYALITRVAVRKKADKGIGERTKSAAHNAVILRRALDSVFRLAIMSGRAAVNPVSMLRASDVIEKPVPRHNKALDGKGLGDLYAAVGGYGGARLTRLAIELLMVTGLRTAELRGADWKEIDWEARVWDVPASRMKRRIEHSIPLSTQALTLLAELKLMTGGKGWMFPNMRRPETFMASTTINNALTNMGFKGASWFRAHGCRGSLSTWAYETCAYRSEAIEQQLSHLERDAVKRAYSRAQYWPERVKMMQAWGDYLSGIKVPAAELQAA